MAKKPKALIVEGDEVIAGMICYFLELQDIACSAVATAEEGLDVAAHGHPDLAIVDASLPGHDGWWMLQSLRRAEGTRHLPVVLLTGMRDETESGRAARLACECLSKPFSYDELNERLGAAARLTRGPSDPA